MMGTGDSPAGQSGGWGWQRMISLLHCAPWCPCVRRPHFVEQTQLCISSCKHFLCNHSNCLFAFPSILWISCRHIFQQVLVTEKKHGKSKQNFFQTFSHILCTRLKFSSRKPSNSEIHCIHPVTHSLHKSGILVGITQEAQLKQVLKLSNLKASMSYLHYTNMNMIIKYVIDT